MPRKDLKNKPLVEAMLELRWVLPDQQSPGMASDPHYRLLLGRFSERVQKDYPAHEPLPTSTIPDSMVPHTVQHRFRATPNGWPLLQMGPGIVTVNDTAGYTWTDFQKRCETAVRWLVDAHPSPSALKFQDVTLRYIDAVAFDYKAANLFDFLRDKMKTTFALPDSLFVGAEVASSPASFHWQASFEKKEPDGTVTIRFATGAREGQASLIWETLVQSTGAQVPSMPAEFPKWLESAHDITDDWFFKLIEGDLERRFSGE
ncbi:MAG: TIGR04255 family protein [Planctomycetes bacterium]|nr:TIGR04255 family protein [Planctomycetota bacterium]MBM4085662.1 TIGR04255 family protein [Planctomycetota bacterium]